MNPYQKESLNLQIGDWISWQNQPQDLIQKNGERTTYLTPGTKGKVVDLHDGNPPTKLETVDTSTLPWAFIEWETGEKSSVDLDMKWEKVPQ